jgi:hypothetical protein
MLAAAEDRRDGIRWGQDFGKNVARFLHDYRTETVNSVEKVDARFRRSISANRRNLRVGNAFSLAIPSVEHPRR